MPLPFLLPNKENACIKQEARKGGQKADFQSVRAAALRPLRGLGKPPALPAGMIPKPKAFLTSFAAWRAAAFAGVPLCEPVKQELVEYPDYHNSHRMKAKRRGLPPAIHRQQAPFACMNVFLLIMVYLFESASFWRKGKGQQAERLLKHGEDNDRSPRSLHALPEDDEPPMAAVPTGRPFPSGSGRV